MTICCKLSEKDSKITMTNFFLNLLRKTKETHASTDVEFLRRVEII